MAHGEFGNGVFQRLVEARRETWIGSDGSGLIKSARVRWSFFADEQRTRWESASYPEAVEDLSPTMELFAPVRSSSLGHLRAGADSLRAERSPQPTPRHCRSSTCRAMIVA